MLCVCVACVFVRAQERRSLILMLGLKCMYVHLFKFICNWLLIIYSLILAIVLLANL